MDISTETKRKTTDWSLCIFCQEETKELLQCPAVSKNRSGSGYTTIANNLESFSRLGNVPMNIDVQRLGGTECASINNTFIANSACWHKTCSLRFNTTTVKTAKKRKLSAPSDTPQNIHVGLSEIQYNAPADNASSKAKKICRTSIFSHNSRQKCLICNFTDSNHVLRSVSTFQVDTRVRECAAKLQDSDLLAKLSSGDLIAQEAKYHPACLCNLYRRANQMECTSGKDSSDALEDNALSHGLAFAQLTQYIEDCREGDTDNKTVLKLSSICKQYYKYLKKFDETPAKVHSTRLKHKLLAFFPDLQAHPDGKETLLVFTESLGEALRTAHKNAVDEEAFILLKAAKIIRRDIFALNEITFNGQFNAKSQISSVPQTLLSLAEMMIDGTSSELETETKKQAALSVSQLIVFNCVKRPKEGNVPNRHSQDRESPLPVFVGLTIHAKTRKRELVDILYDLGLSISYDRIRQISTQLTNGACQQYVEENVVCPAKLKSDLFTTAAIDNIDHDPSSTTAQGSFHGTGISVFQHPSVNNPGRERASSFGKNLQTSQGRLVEELPDFYSEIPPCVLKKNDVTYPRAAAYHLPEVMKLEDIRQFEEKWLSHVDEAIKTETQELCDVSWAAYHANNDEAVEICQSVSSLLPLFPENADSAAMLKHGMNMISRATSFLNPGQTPVIAADQPLYAILKQIQWQFPTTHGEEKFVIMFGGLHIEMAFLKVLGTLLADSGWTDAIVASQIASSGKADSFLRGSHVKRSRRAHEITVCSLYYILHEAYDDSDHSDMSLNHWINKKSQVSPTFHFWVAVMNLELLLLSFVGSFRSGDFKRYIQTVECMIPWMFALDHPNYARWLSVHIQDMKKLTIMHPGIAEEFEKGNFVVHKTENRFSAIPLDHAREQNNATVKGDGGAIGLTEKPSSLRRWAVGGPEVSRILQEFEKSVRVLKNSTCIHHEESISNQKSFVANVKALTDVMKDFGNPFLDQSNDLTVLSTRDIASAAVVETMKTIERLGQTQYELFVEKRFTCNVPLSDPIKRNRLAVLSSPHLKSISTSKFEIANLKNNCSLFSRLYISCQTRDGNLDDFFRHENQPCPPSISHQGMLRPCNKSQLLQCLEDVSLSLDVKPDVDVTILDGAAIINMLKPGDRRTFSGYVQEIFFKYLEKQLQHIKRLDIVWDVYKSDSLKATARARRGQNVRRRVEANSPIPHKWQEFLRNGENKTELFCFIANELANLETDKHIVSTVLDSVISNKPYDVSGLSPCNHEEADTRMMLHMSEANKNGHKRFLIRTVDTDVVVLAISTACHLHVEEVWIAFGTGKQFRYIGVHEIMACLGPEKSLCLPLFHSFTGCDTVSSFNGIGKKKAWQVWSQFPEATKVFLSLQQALCESLDSHLENLERFVILMYDRTSQVRNLNQARKQLFSSKGRSIENIPPTSAAFVQHVKRAVYQGYVWGQCKVRCPDLPDPSNWGWKRSSSNSWEPLWSTLQDVSSTCQQLLKCACTKGCKNRCKCKKAALKCTALCRCSGDCDVNY